MEEAVKVTRDGKVLEIVFERPPANAINRAASYSLYDAFKRLNEDDTLLVGILSGGGGKFFSAGWDLKEVASGEEIGRGEEFDLGPGGLGGLTEFWGLNKPVIAAVNGWAVGGGFEMAMAADIVLAADGAQFFLPEMQRGFLPDAGAVQRLPRLLPWNVAIDLMLTGRRMGASEAKHWGLVRDVHPADQLMDAARELAAQIAEGAPLVLRALKEVVTTLAPLPLRDAFAKTRSGWVGKSGMVNYERMMQSDDYMEGPRAFAEKRKPVWRGR